MFKIHIVKDKYYFEIPKDLMKRDFMISSRVSSTSNNKDVAAGQMPHNPVLVTFSADDKKVYMHRKMVRNLCDTTSNMYEAFQRNFSNPIWEAYKIESLSPDSSAYVVNMSALFITDVPEFSPFRSENIMDVLRKKKAMKGSLVAAKSSILGMKCFPLNINIKTLMSYTVDGGPFTVTMTRNIILLPEEMMRSRYADSRIGYFDESKRFYTEKKDGLQELSYINRWNLQPKPEDWERYKKGELVEPQKPIIYYVDTAIPDKWRDYVKKGIEDWQVAFEEIGFKNAIAAKPYPKDDPEFDPDNIKYSCIRYAPIAIANAMGPSWVDPRSGEILNASVYVYHDVMKLLNNWLFVQTAQADERVRAVTIPEEVIGDGLRYVVAHEVGHCLGYMHNMSASAVIPVDSLRSPSFTQKYGTTTSIMDYARFNYVARPGDRERGVKLTPPRFGLYDYYAVKWLYTPVPDAATAADEYAVTSKWITGAAADSVYRFGKQQFSRSIDPRSQSEDLGDDAVKASGYGIANLKYILGNMNAWIGAQDPDFSQRRTLYDEVLTQYIRYLNHVLANVGGIYFAEKMEGDPVEAYRSVPRERQRESLLFCLAQLKDLKWLDNAELMRNMPLMVSPAESIAASLVAVAVAAPARVALSAALAEKDAYTPGECRKDVYDFVWAPTLKGRTPDPVEMMLQREYVRSLSLSAGLKYTGTGAREEKKIVSDEGLIPVPAFLEEHAARTAGLTACGGCCCHDPFEAFSAAHRVDTAPLLGYSSPRLNYYDPRNTEAGDYAALLKLRAMLRSKSTSSTGEARLHYELLLRNIEKALKK